MAGHPARGGDQRTRPRQVWERARSARRRQPYRGEPPRDRMREAFPSVREIWTWQRRFRMVLPSIGRQRCAEEIRSPAAAFGSAQPLWLSRRALPTYRPAMTMTGAARPPETVSRPAVGLIRRRFRPSRTKYPERREGRAKQHSAAAPLRSRKWAPHARSMARSDRTEAAQGRWRSSGEGARARSHRDEPPHRTRLRAGRGPR